MNLFLLIVGILFLLAVIFVVYCCLVMASIADRQLEIPEIDHQQLKDKMIQPK